MPNALATIVSAPRRGRRAGGAHAHEDYPDRDDENWRKHSLAWVNGKVDLDYRPVHLNPLMGHNEGGIDLKRIAPKGTGLLKRMLLNTAPARRMRARSRPKRRRTGARRGRNGAVGPTGEARIGGEQRTGRRPEAWKLTVTGDYLTRAATRRASTRNCVLQFPPGKLP